MSKGALTLLSPPSVSTGSSTDAPYGLAASPDSKNVYAILRDAVAIAQFAVDQATGQLSQIPSQPLSISMIPTIAAGAAPRYVAVSPDGKHVYATVSGHGDIFIYARSATDGSLTYLNRVRDANMSSPQGIVISPDNKFVYVAMSTSSKIAQFSREATTGLLTYLSTNLFLLPASSVPAGMAITQTDNGLGVYAACTSTNVIYCMNRDPVTGLLSAAATPTVPTPSNFPQWLTITDDDAFLYAACDSGLQYTGCYSRDPSTNALTQLAHPAQTTDNNGGPWSIAVGRGPGNLMVYQALSDIQKITQYVRNPDGTLAFGTPGSVLTSNSGGASPGSKGPYAVTVLPNNKYLYATDLGAGTISQFSIEQGATTTTSVSTDFPGTFDVRATVQQDFAGSFDVRATVSKDIAGAFDVLATVQRDFASTFDVRQQVFRDFVGTFDVAGVTGPIDVSKISPSRIVVFEGSGSRVVVFESSGPRVRFDQMSAKVPVKVGEKWQTDRDPDEKSHYAADITDELADRATTAASVELILVGVVQLELPQIQVATLAGTQRTFVVAFLGGTDTDPPEGWKWVARVTCANGERFDKTTWFNKVDP
jgi:6-phosphogluconolactonase (cycloisomerase 2 family)